MQSFFGIFRARSNIETAAKHVHLSNPVKPLTHAGPHLLFPGPLGSGGRGLSVVVLPPWKTLEPLTNNNRSKTSSTFFNIPRHWHKIMMNFSFIFFYIVFIEKMKHSNPELRLKYLTNMCVNTVAELSTVECPGVTGDMGTEYTVVLVAERSAVFLS